MAASREKHLLGSERDGNFRANTYHQGFSLNPSIQNLDVVRSEIRAFLETDVNKNTKKFIDKISQVYEDYIQIQEQELQKAHSDINSIRKIESARNEGRFLQESYI